MKLARYPKISIVLLVLNGGERLKASLESVKKQDYPKEKLELIVIDNGSIDNSVSLAKQYTDHVSVNRQDVFKNRADGMRMATGDYIYMILEQDMEFRSKEFLQKMVQPFLENDTIAATFTRDYPRKDQPWVTRFISYDPIQRDPLFEFLTPSIEETIIEKKKNYNLCNFQINKLPPVTHMLYMKSVLKKTAVWNQKKDFDHDTVVGLLKQGYHSFAYVPSAGTYHHHAKDLRQLIGKRVRNLQNHFFPYNATTEYKWIDLSKKVNVLRLISWVFYANLFVPASVRGIYRAVKLKDWVLLLEPIIAITTTDAILIAFLRNNTGREILFNALKKLAR